LGMQPARRWPALYLMMVLTGAAVALIAQSTSIVKGRATEVSTDHLRIRYDNEVKAGGGGLASLALDVVPRPQMHVYAPGADDYQVINLTISKQPGLRVRPMKYPQSELYLFQPLNERIPVYQKPFRLAVDVVVDAGSVSQSPNRVTIAGQLDYQACDDKVCFAPLSVPLEWTIVR